MKTSERVDPKVIGPDAAIVARHVFAYVTFSDFCDKNSEVLDYGCGTGHGSEIMARVAKKVVGVDIDKKVVVQARKEHQRDNLSFEVSKGMSMGWEKFNVVVSAQVLEHVEDAESYLLCAYNSLKPGGVLLLTTPNREIRLRPGEKPWNRFHVREYSHQSLSEEVSGIFDSVEMYGVTSTNKKVYDDELRRVQRKAKIARMDVLGLRRFIPSWLEYGIVRACQMVSKPSEGRLNDLWLTNYNLDKCLDLFVIATKRR